MQCSGAGRKSDGVVSGDRNRACSRRSRAAWRPTPARAAGRRAQAQGAGWWVQKGTQYAGVCACGEWEGAGAWGFSVRCEV